METLAFCIYDNYGRLMCYDLDDQEWAWQNMYENDGTVDNSAWTSVVTDGMLYTSPSVDDLRVRSVNRSSNRGKRYERAASPDQRNDRFSQNSL